LSVDLSVVIVNFRSADYLRACLLSLDSSSLSLEIIVVDNDSSAHEVAASFSHVVYLPQSQNRWFCGGNNIGIDTAQGKYVLLLNPDTVVQPGALESMVTFLDVHRDYLGITTQMRYPDGSIQRTCSRRPTYAYLLLNHTPLGVIFKALKERLNVWHWYVEWGRDTSQDIEVLPGSCLMMRRGNWRLDDDLLLYFPEDTLSQQFSDKKFRFLADTFITHHEKSVTQSWLATQVYFRDLLVYTRKQHGIPAWLLLAALSRPLVWGIAIKRLVLHTS
jgi:N-acetylglucosaminyl-diphospho-decaprenol L-rhamnosyltransferase